MLRPEILEYYQRGGEDRRLTIAEGRLEFLRTWDILARVLPRPGDGVRVVDVGGATGVYAGPLAAAGYTVHVIDPVPEHVEAAGALPGVTAALGDARALPEPDASADAVLLFGPLYHLTDRADRLLAWRQARRVARPGGVVVAATISRFASLMDGFGKGFFADPRFLPLVEGALTDGTHHNRDASRTWFTTAYFHRPEELAGEVADAGLTLDRVVAVESPLWMIREQLEEILADEERTALLLDLLRRIEAEPSLLGASSHLLTIARRDAPVARSPSEP